MAIDLQKEADRLKEVIAEGCRKMNLPSPMIFLVFDTEIKGPYWLNGGPQDSLPPLLRSHQPEGYIFISEDRARIHSADTTTLAEVENMKIEPGEISGDPHNPEILILQYCTKGGPVTFEYAKIWPHPKRAVRRRGGREVGEFQAQSEFGGGLAGINDW